MISRTQRHYRTKKVNDYTRELIKNNPNMKQCILKMRGHAFQNEAVLYDINILKRNGNYNFTGRYKKVKDMYPRKIMEMSFNMIKDAIKIEESCSKLSLQIYNISEIFKKIQDMALEGYVLVNTEEENNKITLSFEGSNMYPLDIYRKSLENF